MTDSLKKSLVQFSDAPPTPKQDPSHTERIENAQAPTAQPTSNRNSDPSKFPIGFLVAWSAYDDLPKTPITARILGTTLRPIFGKHLCSIGDDVVKAPKSFTFLGVNEEGKKLTEVPGSVNLSGWRVNWKKTTNERPWTHWVPRAPLWSPTTAVETTKASTSKKYKQHKRSRSRSASSSDRDTVSSHQNKCSRGRKKKS